LVKRPFLGEVLRGQAGQGRAERQQQPICLIKRMLFLGQFVWQLGPSSRRAPVSSGQALNFFFGTNDTTLCLDRRCRLFEATRIALTSKPCLAASSSRTRRTSSTMGSLGMSYSPISSSGVQMTGHSHACSRQMKARDLAITAFAMCTQFQVTRKSIPCSPGHTPECALDAGIAEFGPEDAGGARGYSF
jgi:hypothetical protein